MADYRILLDAMPWETPAPFMRVKTVNAGRLTMRLVEFQRGFVEEDWCPREHAGFVLSGRMMVEFAGGASVEFSAGDGIDIPLGPAHRHKATPLTESVLLLLVE